MTGTRSFRVLAALLVALGLTLAGPALGASAAPAQAAAGVVLPMKNCAPPPEPARPTSGLPGKLAVRPTVAPTADPFTDPHVAISDVYGYSYKWVDYDEGCLPGTNRVTTDLGNVALAGAAATNAVTQSMLNNVVDPTWLKPLDQPLTQATEAVKNGFYGPWFTVILLLVAAMILVAAARADVSGAVTSAGWALIVLVGTTFLMSYPVTSAQAIDGLIGETVTASARAAGTALTPTTATPATPATPAATPASDASRALTAQIDVINRNSLYASWLEGTLGSSTSKLAIKYGPALFRASHLTWSEADTVENDPTAGKTIIETKQASWVDTAAKVEQEDAQAYQQLTGNKGRFDAATSVTIQTLVTMPFLLIAGVFVVFAYGATRVFIPLVPALGVFGMLEVARGWVLATVGQFARILFMGPLFWLGALVNLALVSSVLRSDVPYALKLILALMMPIVLFKLLLPKKSAPGMGALGRLARAGAGYMLTRGAVADGVADSSRPKEAPVADTPAPLAPAPATSPAYMAPASAATRPALGTRQPLLGIGGGTGRSGADLVHGFRDVTSPRSTPQTFGPGSGRRALTTTRRPELEAVPAPVHQDLRPHPAVTSDDDGGYRPAPAIDADRRPTPQTDDLTAPARIMRQGESIPQSVFEANISIIEGESVFTVWRPHGASTRQMATAAGGRS